MKRVLLVAVACSSLAGCTFAHALTHRPTPAPSVSLSPNMAKLDREQRTAPWWTFVGDTTLAMGGFMAGPIADGRVSDDLVQPINLAGFAVCGLVFASLAYTAFALDGL